MNITPNYGSRLSFSVATNDYRTNDGYLFVQPASINSTDITFSVKVENQEYEEIAGLLAEIKSVSGTGDFLMTDSLGFYKDLYFNIDRASLTYKNNDLVDVDLQFTARNEAHQLNALEGFLQNDFVKIYTTGTYYDKYDVVYDESVISFAHDGVNVGVAKGCIADAFFYCTESHLATGGILEGGKFTREMLPITPREFSLEVMENSSRNSFLTSFDQRINQSQLIHELTQPVSLNFENLSDKQARCALHFLGNKMGWRRFNVDISPTIIPNTRTFVCKDWSHEFNYKESNTISLTLEPDHRFFNTGYSIDTSASGNHFGPMMFLEPVIFCDLDKMTSTGQFSEWFYSTGITPTGAIRSSLWDGSGIFLSGSGIRASGSTQKSFRFDNLLNTDDVTTFCMVGRFNNSGASGGIMGGDSIAKVFGAFDISSIYSADAFAIRACDNNSSVNAFSQFVPIGDDNKFCVIVSSSGTRRDIYINLNGFEITTYGTSIPYIAANQTIEFYSPDVTGAASPLGYATTADFTIFHFAAYNTHLYSGQLTGLGRYLIGQP